MRTASNAVRTDYCPGTDSGHIRVLLVEDDAILTLAEKMLLEGEGFEVRTANTGEDAVSIAMSDAQVSIILMDVDLGRGIDGLEAARLILAGRDLPIIFLSNSANPEVRSLAFEKPFHGLVAKVPQSTVLSQLIRNAISDHESR